MIVEENKDGVTYLTIRRPERRNALNNETVQQLLEILESVASAQTARAVVLQGSGSHFCAGRDLTESHDELDEAVMDKHRQWADVFRVLNRIHCPSIAVVRGMAVGGGFTLAMGCDFVLADSSARFGAVEMSRGFPAAICVPMLARLAPPRVGLELGMLGELVTAKRLYEVGMVNRISDPQGMEEMVETFVARIRTLAPTAVRQTLELHRAGRGLTRDDALTMGVHLNQLIEASGRFRSAENLFEQQRKASRT